LSCIVIIALKGIIWQIGQFFEFKKQSAIDAGVWLITFLTVVIFNIKIGLLVGFTASTIVLFVRSLWTHVSVSGLVPNTDLYLDIYHYERAVEIPGLKIFRFCGSINFATKASFVHKLKETLNINITKELKNLQDNKQEQKSEIDFQNLIIDFSSLTYLDATGLNSMLVPLINDLNKLNVKVLLAGCHNHIVLVLKKHQFPQEILYPTVHDAVRFLKLSSSQNFNIVLND
jgi:solute carrier family 26 protein